KYKEEIVEKEKGKKATKLRRVYDKAVSTEEGKDKDLPYSGKTLLIEKKGGKYTFQIEGGDALSDKQVPNLAEEFARQQDEEQLQEQFLPKKAVAVNDGWEIDKDALKTLFAKDAEKGKMEI